MEDVNVLIEQLRSADVASRRQAAQRLAQSGSQAANASAALAAACDEADETTLEWVAAALEESGPPPPNQQPQLMQLLGNSCALTRYWATTLLGRLATAVDAAVPPRLAQALAQDPDLAVRERAAWALGEMGPAAQPAEPALEAAAASGEARLARLAKKALENLKS